MSPIKQFWRPLAIIVTAVVLVELAMLLLDMGPDVALVAAIVALCGSAIWCLTTLSGTAAVATPIPPGGEATTSLLGSDRYVRTLRTAVLSSDDDYYAAALRARLAAVIDDQLEHTHGIARIIDPEAAEVAMGPDLYQFIQGGTVDLERIVTLIEQL